MAKDNNLPPDNNSESSPSAMFLEMMRQAAARRAEMEDDFSPDPDPKPDFNDLDFQLSPDIRDFVSEDELEHYSEADAAQEEDTRYIPEDELFPDAEASSFDVSPQNLYKEPEPDSVDIPAYELLEEEAEEDIPSEDAKLAGGRVPVYTAPPQVTVSEDELAAKMEAQRIRRIRRRQERQQKRRVGIIGGFLRTALITVIAAVLASTIFTWFTDPEFFTSNVVTGLQVVDSTSVVVAAPMTPTAFAVTPNWARRIGIVSGHRGPENDPGAVCDDGLTEREINFAVAQLVVLSLRERGYSVDLLDEFDPRLNAYQAAALVSIHANDCQDYGEFVSGYLVARAAARPAGGLDDILAECIARDYGTAVGIQRRFSLTIDMTDYHTFREIHPLTPAAILELGFMRGDRDLLVNQQETLAEGITNGILCFLNGEIPFETDEGGITPEPELGVTPIPLGEATSTEG